MNIESAVTVNVLFFAKAREIAGVTQSEFKVNSRIPVEELLFQICSSFHLETIKTSIILAVNEQFCDNPQEQLHLKNGDEIAIVPPISGG